MRTNQRFLLGAALLASGAAHANLIQNGSFESGAANPTSFVRLSAGSMSISQWLVGGRDVDYAGKSLWNASDGLRSVDLDGSATGSLSQSFATAIGSNYLVTFDLSGNPGALPYDKKLRVTAGESSTDFTHTIGTNHIGNSGLYPWVIPYESHSFAFTATSTTTTLKFASLTNLFGPAGWGPVIDNVDVELAAIAPPPAVPEPSSVVLMVLGIAAIGAAKRRKAG